MSAFANLFPQAAGLTEAKPSSAAREPDPTEIDRKSLTLRNTDNRHNFANQIEETDENSTLLQTLSALTSDQFDDDAIDDEPEDDSTRRRQANQQQQRRQLPEDNLDEEPVDVQDQIVSKFMRSQMPQTFMDKFDYDKFTQRIASGDPGAMPEAFNELGADAVRKSLAMMLKMIPGIAQSIQAKVLAEVNSRGSQDQVWSNFISKHPDFAPYKNALTPHLAKAMKASKNNQAAAFNAVAQLYSGFVQAKNPRRSDNSQSRSNEAFDLDAYINQ